MPWLASNKPIISVDGTPLLRQNSDGVSNYARNVLQELARQLPKRQFVIIGFQDDPISLISDLLQCKNIRLKLLPLPRKLYSGFYSRIKPIGVDSGLGFKPDYHLGLNFTNFPYIKSTKNLPFIHDLAYFDLPATVEKKNRKYLAKIVPWSIKTSYRVIAISPFTQKRLAEIYRPRQPIILCPGGVNNRFYQKPPLTQLLKVKKRYNLPENFYLTVGTNEPRKNLAYLIQTYVQLPVARQAKHPLVILTKPGWHNQAASGNKNILFLTQFIPEADLIAIYHLAKRFILPSLYEGFGLPVYEALASQTPVVVNDIPSFSDLSVEKFSDQTKLLQLLAAPPRPATTNRRQYTWQNSVAELVKLLK